MRVAGDNNGRPALSKKHKNGSTSVHSTLGVTTAFWILIIISAQRIFPSWIVIFFFFFYCKPELKYIIMTEARGDGESDPTPVADKRRPRVKKKKVRHHCTNVFKYFIHVYIIILGVLCHIVPCIIHDGCFVFILSSICKPSRRKQNPYNIQLYRASVMQYVGRYARPVKSTSFKIFDL